MLYCYKLQCCSNWFPETKLGNTIYDSEVAVDGYSLVWSNRNRNGGGVASYVRNKTCFNMKKYLSSCMEDIFIDLMFSKTKPVSTEIIYKTLKQTRLKRTLLFLEVLIWIYFLNGLAFLTIQMKLRNFAKNVQRILENILIFDLPIALSNW